MWNKLDESVNNDIENEEANRGFFFLKRKYRNYLYILLGIVIIYALLVAYYEISETSEDKKIDCNVLEENCKDVIFPEFDREKLIVVDVNTKNNNFLLRSDVPIFDGKFSEDKLLEEIKIILEQSNLYAKGNYSLYIISLLKDNKRERCYLTSEKCYAENAIIKNEPIFGSKGVDPYDLTDEELEKELKSLSWNTDDILKKIDNLNSNFLNFSNSIFLVHCLRGKDRTGEYVGAYRMIIKRHTFDSVIKSNYSIGLLKKDFVIMQKWICLYLEKVLNYSNIGCYNYKNY